MSKTFNEFDFLLENKGFQTKPVGKNQQGMTRGDIIISWIKPQKRVLDIGCKDGGMGREAVNRGCWVMGVEKEKKEAEKAKERYHKVIWGDIEEKEIQKKIKEDFHYIICADVLEHLQSPEKMMRQLKKFLKKDGRILISIPNIAHWSIRCSLLQGEFRYTSRGILDSSHRHFFTNDSFTHLIQKTGYGLVDSDFLYAASPLDKHMKEQEKWTLIEKHQEFFALQFLYQIKLSVAPER